MSQHYFHPLSHLDFPKLLKKSVTRDYTNNHWICQSVPEKPTPALYNIYNIYKLSWERRYSANYLGAFRGHISLSLLNKKISALPLLPRLQLYQTEIPPLPPSKRLMTVTSRKLAKMVGSSAACFWPYLSAALWSWSRYHPSVSSTAKQGAIRESTSQGWLED